MGDKLRDGQAWLAAQQKLHQSESAVYRRGSDSIADLKVTLGRTDQRLGNPVAGGQIRGTDLDVLVTAADLVIDEETIEPLPGDFLDLTHGESTMRYEVCPVSDTEPCFRLDEWGVRMRIHLKFLKVV